MSSLSVNAAAKMFAVSRPTLTKHLNDGKLSGVRNEKGGWQVDKSELARVYALRAAPDRQTVQDNNALQGDLHAKIEKLQRDLAVAEALAEDRKRMLDLKLLEGPKRRGWWPW